MSTLRTEVLQWRKRAFNWDTRADDFAFAGDAESAAKCRAMADLSRSVCNHLVEYSRCVPPQKDDKK